MRRNLLLNCINVFGGNYILNKNMTITSDYGRENINGAINFKIAKMKIGGERNGSEYDWVNEGAALKKKIYDIHKWEI